MIETWQIAVAGLVSIPSIVLIGGYVYGRLFYDGEDLQSFDDAVAKAHDVRDDDE